MDIDALQNVFQSFIANGSNKPEVDMDAQGLRCRPRGLPDAHAGRPADDALGGGHGGRQQAEQKLRRSLGVRAWVNAQDVRHLVHIHYREMFGDIAEGGGLIRCTAEAASLQSWFLGIHGIAPDNEAVPEITDFREQGSDIAQALDLAGLETERGFSQVVALSGQISILMDTEGFTRNGERAIAAPFWNQNCEDFRWQNRKQRILVIS